MNNSAGMSRSQSARNLYGNINRGIQLESAVGHSLAKGSAFDKLGSNKMQAISLPEFINGKNVGVIQSRGGVCFLFKTTQATLVMSQFGRNHFERNLASELDVLGKVNLSHASNPEQGDDFVMRQLSAGGKHFAAIFHRHAMRHLDHGLRQEIYRFLGRMEKRLDLFP